MWVVLSRSRYFIEKYEEGLKFARQGLEQCPESTKLTNMVAVHTEGLAKENRIVAEVETLTAGKTDKRLAIYRQLREHKVRLGKKIPYIPEGQEIEISVDKAGKLHFPVLVLYDEFMQTDFI